MSLELLLAAVASIGLVAVVPNRIVETFVKPAVSQVTLTDANRTKLLRASLLLFGSLVAGVVVAIFGNFNVILMFPADHPFFSGMTHQAGVIITGVFLAFGSNFWHEIGEGAERFLVNTLPKTAKTVG